MEGEPFITLGMCPDDEAPNVCMFCAEAIDDRRYRCLMAVRREWQPGAIDYYAAHVSCLRKAVHPDVGIGH